MPIESYNIGKVSGRSNIKIRGAYRITFTPSSATWNQEYIALDADVFDTFLVLSSDSIYDVKVIPNFIYESTFVSPNTTGHRLSFGNDSGFNSYYDEQKTHSSAGNCGDNLPELPIIRQDVFTVGAESANRRLTFTYDVSGGVGRTVCKWTESLSIILKFQQGGITKINEKLIEGDPITIEEL